MITDFFRWLSAVFAELADGRAWDQAQGVVLVFGVAAAVAAPIFHFARRRSAERRRANRAEAELKRADARIEALRAYAPEPIVEAARKADSVPAQERLRDACADYLDAHREGLLCAHRALADKAIGDAIYDGGAAYETARLHIAAAICCKPTDTGLRTLHDDLMNTVTDPEISAPLRGDLERARSTRDQQAALAQAEGDAATRLAVVEKLWYRGKWALMERIAREGVEEARARLGRRSPETLKLEFWLGWVTVANGHAAEGEALLSETFSAQTEVLGHRNPDTLTTQYGIGYAQLAQGKAAEAEAALRELLQIQEEVLGARHPHTLITRHAIAYAQLEQGKVAEAEAALSALLPIEQEVKGARHPDTLSTRTTISRAQLEQGKASEAAAALRDLLPIRENVLGARHPFTLNTRSVLAKALIALDRGDEARAVHDGVLDQLRGAGLTPDHPFIRRAEEVEAVLSATPDNLT